MARVLLDTTSPEVGVEELLIASDTTNNDHETFTTTCKR